MDNETEAADFLDRLDIDIDDLVSKDKFTVKLADIFARGGRPTPTQKQVNALFDVGDVINVEFPKSNIRKIEFTQFGKPQTRFVLPNQRGLFGLERAVAFFRGLR